MFKKIELEFCREEARLLRATDHKHLLLVGEGLRPSRIFTLFSPIPKAAKRGMEVYLLLPAQRLKTQTQFA